MKSLKCTLKHLNEFKLHFLLLLLLSAFQTIHAQWSKYPSVNNPVCKETDDQLNPNIISDGAGGSIITWYDMRNGKEYDIYAQRLNELGVPQWTTDGIVVCNSSGDQTLPIIAPDGNGGAFIVWLDGASGTTTIRAQQIDASGTIQWATDGVEICSQGRQTNLQIVDDNSGYAIIVWEDARGGGSDIYAQRIASGGKVMWNTDGLEICTETGEQRNPVITMDADYSNAIITWDDTRRSKKGTVYDIFAQKVDVSGSVQWTVNGIDICVAAGDQTMPDIVSDDSGGAIITWQDMRGGTDNDIYAQRVRSGGTMVWLTDGVVICSATGNQVNAQITTDGSFGAIICWIDSRATGAFHIYTQRINYTGSSQWTANGVVTCGSNGAKKIPRIISDQSSGAIIVWGDFRSGTYYDIYTQNLNSAGVMQWTAPNGTMICTAVNDQLNYSLIGDNFGGAFITWNDARGSDKDIYSQNILKEGGLGIVSEILVKGNNLSILDGDVTPVTGDNTDFGSVITLTPINRTFMVYNSGNDDLDITNIYTTGTHKTEFVPQSLTYPFSIAPHDSMAIKVTYTPVGVGISNATLNFDNNDSNEALYNFNLKATFKAPEIDVKGNNVSIIDGDITPDVSDSTDFGKTRLNVKLTRNFTIINSGTDTLKIDNINISGTHSSEFTFPSLTFPRKLGPGKPLVVTVTFLPAATGLRTAVMNITSNDPNEASYDFAIQGTSITPAINVKGNNRNISDGDVTPASNDFTDFGKLNISQQKTSTFKVFNTGSEVLSISSIYIAGLNSTDFSVPSMTYPVLINVGDSLSVNVTFIPLALGKRSAELRIDNDDDGKPTYNFALEATAISQEINIKGNGKAIAMGDNTPLALDNTSFGNVNRNGSKTNRFYVVNGGTDILAVSGIALSGADASLFSLGALTPASPIPAGDSSYFDVTFNPTTNGLKGAVVTITNNDADEGTYDFALQGMSLSPQIGLKGNEIVIPDGSTAVSTGDNTDFGSVEMPNSIIKTFKIVNTGNDALIISAINLTGANASEFALVSMSFPQNIAAGASLTFDINFTPTVEGDRTAVVNVMSNDMDIATYDFGLKGNATKKQVDLMYIYKVETPTFYPNPANSEISIMLPKGSVSANVRIFSFDGKTILYQGNSDNQNTIDVSGLAAGVYMISIESNGSVVNKKLVINR